MVKFAIIINAVLLVTGLQFAQSCQRFQVGSSSDSTQIDATAFCSSFGIQVEACSDVGGGSNVAWLDVNDWITWNIDVKESATYVVRYRVASYSGQGSFELSAGTKKLSLRDSLPKTGWWQNWETVEDLVDLQAGQETLTLTVRQGGWNLNWIEFEKYDEASCQQYQVGSSPAVQIDASAFCSSYGVQVGPTNDVGGGTNVGYLSRGDWMSWNVDVMQSGTYIFMYRIASYSGEGSFELSAGTQTLVNSKSFPKTGGWQNWITVEQEIELEAGNNKPLVLTVLQGGWNINWIKLILSQAALLPPSHMPSEAQIPSSLPRPSPSNVPSSQPIHARSMLPSRIPSESPILVPTRAPLSRPISIPTTSTGSPSGAPTIALSKSPSQKIDIGCQVFQVDLISGAQRIDASAFCSSFGVQLEPTIDVGGGNNVGYLDTGDWLSWNLEVAEENTYLVSYRIASFTGDGAFKFSTNSEELAVSKTLPRTGGWQNWITISQEVHLSAGQMPLKLSVLAAGWNINWIEIKKKEPVSLTGFVRAHNQDIIGLDGQPLLLRGMGLGGWTVQEPYMLRNDFKGQYEFFSRLAMLMGDDGVADYHQAWLDNWMTVDDVTALKAAGFNSIRAAVHYNLFTLPIEKEPVRGKDTWIESGFTRLDQLLQWCIAEEMYLIIDLHAAPGGQGRDSKISDYDDTKPSLWEDPENVRKSIALWKQFATRYANEPWVAGYDLLNEPNWGFSGGNENGCDDTENGPLKDFYDQAIAAIRTVDKNHAIFIEGNCWGNRHHGLWPIDDDNVVLSFHRYWIDNSVGTIQEYLSLRSQYQVPLWMGESGENSDGWYKDAVQLLESNNIGWAWWTHKKMQSNSGVYSMDVPASYQTILNYWRSGGARPDSTFTRNAMMQVAEASLLESVDRNDGAVRALTGCLGMPFTKVAGRTRLQAESYCNMQSVTTENTRDVGGGRNVGWSSDKGWIAHNIDVTTQGTFNIHFRYASLSGQGSLQFEIQSSGQVIGIVSSLPSTGGWQSWDTTTIQAPLPAGQYTIVVRSTSWGWNLNWFEIIQTI